MSPINNHIDGFINLSSVDACFKYIDDASKLFRLVVIATFDNPYHELIHPLDRMFNDRHEFLHNFSMSNDVGMNGVIKETFSSMLRPRDLSGLDIPTDFTAILIGELSKIRYILSGYQMENYPFPLSIPLDRCGMFEVYLGLLRELAGTRPIYAFNIDIHHGKEWNDPHGIS